MNYIMFLIVILLSNIIQGITGFAGTILAMPPSLFLVGYDVAKPILNMLGILAGLYVFMTQGKHIDKKELKKVVSVMVFGILVGIFLKSLFQGQEAILYKILGCYVIFLAIQGLFFKKSNQIDKEENGKIKSNILLICAGLIHGMFVSGGPLLIGYLANKIKDKISFRATISCVWIILNTIIFIDDIRVGLWNLELLKILVVATPVLIVGMMIGSKLYKMMSQQFFMKLTYILLSIAGISLLIK